MRSALTILFVFLFFLFVASSSIEASGLVTVAKDGSVYWNVLSSEDALGLQVPKDGGVVIKKIAQVDNNVGASITLDKKDDKISLVVTTNAGQKEIDVSNWSQDLVEIEDRPEVQKINIGLKDGKFSLQQGGIVALTDLPIGIDAKNAELSAQTSTGSRYISVMPKQAADILMRARYINQLSGSTNLDLNENNDNHLVYKIKGEKVINILNIYKVQVPVEGTVSASTGEIITVDEPTWLKVFGFMLS